MHPHRSYLEYINCLSFRILLIGMIALLAGCADKPSGKMEELNRINRMVDASADSADVALKSLDGMDEGKFSEEERFFHSFITMKARDKSMIPITSDTSYLALQEYYSKHPRNEIYPEVIYYGGRTYSDLGDYPRALKYYNEAYDLIKDDDSKLRQRGKILAQKGWLLDRLTLYEDAASCLEEAVSVDTALGDSVSLMYNSEFLGVVNFHAGRYGQAEKQLLGSLDLAEKYDSCQAGSVKVNLAGLYAKMKEFKKAEGILQEISGHVEPQDLFLAYAAWIYSSLGKRDSAILYASRLVADTSCTTRISGFDILLSPKYAASLPSDTLLEYISEYRRLVKKDYNGYSMQNALLQNTLYNYSVHDRERQKAEKERDDLITLLTCLGLALALVAIAVLIYLWRKEKRFNGLYRRVARISIFKRISSAASAERMKEDGLEKCEESRVANSQDKPRSWQKESLLHSLDTAGDDEAQIRFLEEFHGSPLYLEMMQYIEKKGGLEGNDSMWGKIEGFFSEHCPDFVPQLTVLTAGRLTKQERQTAMLIKLGIRTNDIASLLSKSKGTIVSRRDSLSLKIYGEKKGSRYIDGMIRLL